MVALQLVLQDALGLPDAYGLRGAVAIVVLQILHIRHCDRGSVAVEGLLLNKLRIGPEIDAVVHHQLLAVDLVEIDAVGLIVLEQGGGAQQVPLVVGIDALVVGGHIDIVPLAQIVDLQLRRDVCVGQILLLIRVGPEHGHKNGGEDDNQDDDHGEQGGLVPAQPLPAVLKIGQAGAADGLGGAGIPLGGLPAAVGCVHGFPRLLSPV